MSQFWIRSGAGEWKPAPLNDGAGAAVLSVDGPGVKLSPRVPDPAGTGDAPPAAAVTVRRCRGGADTWVMLSLPAAFAVRVNGWPLYLGLRVLRDRDELRLGDLEPCFFSSERLVRVETMPDSAAESASRGHCPRCKRPIAAGSPCVRCPRCGVFHHQSGELPCWFGHQADPFPTCANCDQRVVPEAESGFQWTPDEL